MREESVRGVGVRGVSEVWECEKCQRRGGDESIRGVEVRSMGCQRSGMREVSEEWG